MKKNRSASGENLFFKIVRVALGLLFVFSSTVKGIDPVGTAYRVEDYLLAYGLDSLSEYKLTLAIILITTEFILGFSLLFKLRYKMAVWGTFLMMLFFLVVTWFDATKNLVPDCGCFGDAVKLSNWATFYKNIVFGIMALLLLFTVKSSKTVIKPVLQNIIVIVVASGFIWFQFYNFHHLPVIDFRTWKTGRDMKIKNADKQKVYVIYKNNKTGEVKEYPSNDFPWNDSTWQAQWSFVDQRIDDSEVIKPHDLVIEDEEGNDVTRDVIENPGYQLLIVSPDLDGANGEGMIKASNLALKLEQENVETALICASGPEEVKKYLKLFKIEYPVYYADDIELKAMIRSNPGMLLLHNGIILKKWHYNDFPSLAEVKDTMADK
jgi:uncharacterized membrane protein YphA (DoxX/SURF4 family)